MPSINKFIYLYLVEITVYFRNRQSDAVPWFSAGNRVSCRFFRKSGRNSSFSAKGVMFTSDEQHVDILLLIDNLSVSAHELFPENRINAPWMDMHSPGFFHAYVEPAFLLYDLARITVGRCLQIHSVCIRASFMDPRKLLRG